MTKTISFGNKKQSADKWVGASPMKRLTIDIPATLHQKVKSSCAAKGQKMADRIRGMLEDAFKS